MRLTAISGVLAALTLTVTPGAAQTLDLGVASIGLGGSGSNDASSTLSVNIGGTAGTGGTTAAVDVDASGSVGTSGISATADVDAGTASTVIGTGGIDATANVTLGSIASVRVDLNGDGVIDGADVELLLALDLNGDGVLNVFDDANGDGVLSVLDLGSPGAGGSGGTLATVSLGTHGADSGGTLGIGGAADRRADGRGTNGRDRAAAASRDRAIGHMASLSSSELSTAFRGLSVRDQGKLKAACSAVLADPGSYRGDTVVVCQAVASL